MLASPSVFVTSISIIFARKVHISHHPTIKVIIIIYNMQANRAEYHGRKADAKLYFSIALNLNVAAFLLGLVVLIIEVSLLMKFLS